MRAISVSMSPSARSRLRHLRRRPSRSAAARSGPARWRRSAPGAAHGCRSSPCGNRGSGRLPRAAAPRRGWSASAATSALRASACKAPVVVGVAHLDEARRRRPLVEALQQRADRVEAQPRVAPVEPGQRIEAVVLDRLDDLGIERPLRRRWCRSVPSLMWRPARPAIWAISAGGQAARPAAVELRERGRRRHGRDPC